MSVCPAGVLPKHHFFGHMAASMHTGPWDHVSRCLIRLHVVSACVNGCPARARLHACCYLCSLCYCSLTCGVRGLQKDEMMWEGNKGNCPDHAAGNRDAHHSFF